MQRTARRQQEEEGRLRVPRQRVMRQRRRQHQLQHRRLGRAVAGVAASVSGHWPPQRWRYSFLSSHGGSLSLALALAPSPSLVPALVHLPIPFPAPLLLPPLVAVVLLFQILQCPHCHLPKCRWQQRLRVLLRLVCKVPIPLTRT